MTLPRASGILLHPTSLPGGYGIGDLGDAAFRFIDFLVETGQTYWQILPLGPTGFGDSPYQCFSAFAGNTLMISPEKLIEDGLITTRDLAAMPEFVDHKIDFDLVNNWKNQLLSLAYEGFHHVTSVDLRGKFETFCQDNEAWLDDYALYRSIKSSENQRPWYEWPERLKLRDEQALAAAGEQFFDGVQAQKFYQFLFFHQWFAVKRYANRQGVKIIGDIPIFVALDSADVWCNQDKFKLEKNGSAKVVAGVPPDYFSKTGQLWGNPIYNWDAMLRDDFRWWIARVNSTLRRIVGSSGHRQNSRERPLGRRSRKGSVCHTQTFARRSAGHRGGSRRNNTGC